MATRGIVGFTAEGQDHFVYNHFDSYPDGLGEDMVAFVINKVAKNTELYRAMAAAMRDVSGTDPTPEDIKACREYTDLGVSNNQSTDDWYCLLRDTQGDPEAILKCGLYENYNDFIYDSLFCEYAYVINFDTGMLEFYEGFQKAPHDNGRFASSESESGYYPCALVGEYPFDDIPEDWIEQLFHEEDEEVA
jgi:hypothetical protein